MTIIKTITTYYRLFSNSIQCLLTLPLAPLIRVLQLWNPETGTQTFCEVVYKMADRVGLVVVVVR
jgi:hypothetical protein